ncbi:hypothetical protein [Phaeobacter piscinae]
MTAISMVPSRADAYQVDCAILLCLAGGWPPSAPCAHARAVFIRRITPWPVEPPLQIWRCPMKSAMNTAPGNSPYERLYNFAFADAPNSEAAITPIPAMQSSGFELPSLDAVFRLDYDSPEISGLLQKVAGEISSESGKADIDISGPDFDYVRSIRVYHVRFEARKEKDYCGEHDSTQIGVYGPQGEFSWTGFSAKAVPTYVMPRVRGCPEGGRRRAVGIEWRDYEGNVGSEIVYY